MPTVTVEVVCPECGNRNRQARRSCLECRGRGAVTKTTWVPDDDRGGC